MNWLEWMKIRMATNKRITDELKSQKSRFEREIKHLTPPKFAVHLDTQDGINIQADFDYGYETAKKDILEKLNSTKL